MPNKRVDESVVIWGCAGNVPVTEGKKMAIKMVKLVVMSAMADA